VRSDRAVVGSPGWPGAVDGLGGVVSGLLRISPWNGAGLSSTEEAALGALLDSDFAGTTCGADDGVVGFSAT
jgi:hypothetical protein